jgi:hypothetical protein
MFHRLWFSLSFGQECAVDDIVASGQSCSLASATSSKAYFALGSATKADGEQVGPKSPQHNHPRTAVPQDCDMRKAMDIAAEFRRADREMTIDERGASVT